MSVIRAFAVVVAHEGGADLARCVSALLDAGYGALQVIVVDNASRDGACERVARAGDPRVAVLAMTRNLGFAGGVNAAIAHLERTCAPAPDDVIVLVNQDCIVEPGAIGALVTRVTCDRRVGIVGSRLLAADGATLQHAGGIVYANGLTEHYGRGFPDSPMFANSMDVEYVTGALMALRFSTWRLLGPLDAAYHPVYFEDVDYCIRARAAGLRVVYEPASVAVHAEASASGGPQSRSYLRRYHRSRMRFVARHSLRRGTFMRAIAAEVRWLLGRRRLREVTPAVRAYFGLPRQIVRRRSIAYRG